MSTAERDKWNHRYRTGSHTSLAPSQVLVDIQSHLPRSGRALDVGGGAGRHSLWLARRGLTVTLADISEVAAHIARERAQAEYLPLETAVLDLESAPLPEGPWDLILIFHFLLRPLFPQLPLSLAPGGTLVVIHPTVRNLERHEKPGRAYLLAEGELPTLVPTLTVVHAEEGWLSEGRHESALVARRDPAT